MFYNKIAAGVVAALCMAGTAEAASLESYVTKFMPASSEVTAETSLGGMGLAVVQWQLTDADIKLDRESKASVYMMNEYGQRLATLSPANPEQIDMQGTSVNEQTTNIVTFVFADSAEAAEPFMQSGMYMLIVEDGVFTLGGEPLEGTSEMYEFKASGSADIDFTYTTNPEEGGSVSIPREIRVTFTGASSVDYETTGGGRLVNGDGVRVIPRQSAPAIEGNTLVYKFDDPVKGPIEWIPGEYTFTIAADEVCIDSETGNFPGLTLKFFVTGSDTQTGVTAVYGLDGADRYEVFTTAGVKVLDTDSAEALAGLARGLYIINGKKVMVSK